MHNGTHAALLSEHLFVRNMPPTAQALFGTRKEARTVLQQTALLYLFLAFFLPHLCVPDYHPDALLPPNIKAATDVFLLYGANILGFALQLEPGPCGPYNQFVKCPQAFEVALSYPDRWFRNRFRYVVKFEQVLRCYDRLNTA